MKDNKEIPVLLIVFISAFLLLGIVSLFTNRLLTKDNVKDILVNQDLPERLKSDNELNKVIEERKIPIESISNIDDDSIVSYLDEGLDRLYSNERPLVKSDEINTIIKKSINKYGKEKSVDIYSNIEEDIKEVSKKIYKNVNVSESIDTFNIVNSSSNVYLVFFLVTIILLIIMILKNKKESTLYIGCIFAGIPIISYLIIKRVSVMILKEIDFININKFLEERISNIAINICSKIFIIGIVLLIIYAVFMTKKILREFRIKYVYKY